MCTVVPGHVKNSANIGLAKISTLITKAKKVVSRPLFFPYGFGNLCSFIIIRVDDLNDAFSAACFDNTVDESWKLQHVSVTLHA